MDLGQFATIACTFQQLESKLDIHYTLIIQAEVLGTVFSNNGSDCSGAISSRWSRVLMQQAVQGLEGYFGWNTYEAVDGDILTEAWTAMSAFPKSGVSSSSYGWGAFLQTDNLTSLH
ncbi:unnamed protein product [Nezara viridula]|uniref:Uncharacterized protein n=1 Tax=Nezara viridula TaxID=85310 RepID=A0A9P0MXJ7_NEZVI|nr:unnamed protein product [Nezara viridula]